MTEFNEDDQYDEEKILLIEQATLAMLEHMGVDPTDPANEKHLDENDPGSEINTYKELAIVAMESMMKTAEKIDDMRTKESVDYFKDYVEDNFGNKTSPPKQEEPENTAPDGYGAMSILNFYVEKENPSDPLTLGAVRRFVNDLDTIQAPDDLEVVGSLDASITRYLHTPEAQKYGVFIECGDCGARDVLVQSHDCEYADDQ